ncbi:Protein of unknown function [Azospirillum lipoferum 4B]|uniref:Uncharacterized protein n=1 Tax=Azospirillum lipoferum (strain 4B) TaxID=862719 RepID=G7Z897_AZOL4|nr:Protein of unknown function [Azospirillum lipoferum 4B]
MFPRPMVGVLYPERRPFGLGLAVQPRNPEWETRSVAGFVPLRSVLYTFRPQDSIPMLEPIFPLFPKPGRPCQTRTTTIR